MDPTLILAAAQAALGTVQSIAGAGRAKRLLAQRRAFTTPEADTKKFQLLQDLSQQGYDAATLSYLTNQTDRAFNKTLGVAERVGANPNDLASLFDTKVNDIMKIGADNHALNMGNISKLLTGYDTLAADAAAEWKSQQDLLKDKQQAASAQQQAGFQNILGGVNTAVSGFANNKIMDLYKPKPAATVPFAPVGAPGQQSASTLTNINLPTTGNYNPSYNSPGLSAVPGNEGLINALNTLKQNGVDISGIDWSQYY